MGEDTKRHFDALEASLDGRFANLAKLIEDHSQSLQAEMRSGFDRLDAATARNTRRAGSRFQYRRRAAGLEREVRRARPEARPGNSRSACPRDETGTPRAV